MNIDQMKLETRIELSTALHNRTKAEFLNYIKGKLTPAVMGADMIREGKTDTIRTAALIRHSIEELLAELETLMPLDPNAGLGAEAEACERTGTRK